MIAFIEDHRSVFGVGSICKLLPIAPSTFYARKAINSDSQRASQRAMRDVIDRDKTQEAFDDSGKRYGARKIWHQLRRSKHDIARCTVERLMKVMGLQGVVRGKPVITTNPFAGSPSQPCPDDKVNREFKAQSPNQLWGRPCRRHWFEPNGRRLHLCFHLAGHGLCRICCRCLLSKDRWLARIDIDDDSLCT